VKYLSYEEVNSIAKEYLKLKVNSENSKKDKDIFKKYQNQAVNKLSYIIKNKAGKYRKFSNHADLEQEGYVALMMAFESYKVGEGCFYWWAKHYVETRISRSANTHSTIRIPLKKAKEMTPYKTNISPDMECGLKSPFENVESKESSEFVMNAINQLPQEQRRAIMIAFDYTRNDSSITSIIKELKVSRPTCNKIIKEAKRNLKEKLAELK